MYIPILYGVLRSGSATHTQPNDTATQKNVLHKAYQETIVNYISIHAYMITAYRYHDVWYPFYVMYDIIQTDW